MVVAESRGVAQPYGIDLLDQLLQRLGRLHAGEGLEVGANHLGVGIVIMRDLRVGEADGLVFMNGRDAHGRGKRTRLEAYPHDTPRGCDFCSRSRQTSGSDAPNSGEFGYSLGVCLLQSIPATLRRPPSRRPWRTSG